MGEGAQKFIVILGPEERGIISAHCPAVQCSSQGYDRSEALEMIVECIQITLDEYQKTKDDNPSLIPLPLAETPELISDEVREILEFCAEYEMAMTLEIVEVVVPAQVLV